MKQYRGDNYWGKLIKRIIRILQPIKILQIKNTKTQYSE